MFKIDLLPVGKPIDPMARRVGVAHETRGVWTAREEPRGSPFLVMSTFRCASAQHTGHQFGLEVRSGL